ncbi:MAG TPA: hypothetical protein VJ673_24500 [Aromatoleum sp.]|uniref:hypothetical protein n=1 Tax=Aromatoleum sp. TaxID=2307007 RepID=UPI002B45B10C|nr:hypothetical protein [Aromatoleum sp.]HJV28859.1 hypothetical protein [Aromatoleum sp.]
MRPELKEMGDSLLKTVKDVIARAVSKSQDEQLEVVAGLEARLLSRVSELEARIADLEAGK